MEIPRWLALAVLMLGIFAIAYGIWRAKRKKPTSRGIG